MVVLAVGPGVMTSGFVSRMLCTSLTPAPQALSAAASVRATSVLLQPAPTPDAEVAGGITSGGSHAVRTLKGTGLVARKLTQPTFSPQAVPLKSPQVSITTPPPGGAKLTQPVFSPQAW